MHSTWTKRYSKSLDLPLDREPDLKEWEEFVNKVKHYDRTVKIALVGKYTELPDAYKSIVESFVHAGAANHVHVNLTYVNSEMITPENVGEALEGMSGILVAPGFGHRGIEGKITAVRYARENGIPFLGICLGMQCAVIEFARNVLGYEDADSTEMRKTAHPVIDLMEEQKGVMEKGGTMRLGAYPCRISQPSKLYDAYASGARSRTAQAPLRIQQRLHRRLREGRHEAGRHQPRLEPRRSGRTRRTSVVHRRTVPSGIQKHGQQAAPALPGVRRSCGSLRSPAGIRPAGAFTHGLRRTQAVRMTAKRTRFR